MHWEKSPAELAERFGSAMDRFGGVERRKMFGYPAAFVNGNMVTGLHGSSWFVRLPEDAAAELLALEGAGPFEPMPGRPMNGYVVLPATLVGDDAALERWLGRALDHGRSLPPKGAGRR